MKKGEILNKNLGSKNFNKKRFLRFTIAFILIIAVIGGILWVYENYLSPDAKYSRETKENIAKYDAWKENYEKAMREDTYGGKTPQETLDMFVDALKKGDVEL